MVRQECECETGTLEKIAETAPLKRSDGVYQSTAIYQCDFCLSFFKRKSYFDPTDLSKDRRDAFEFYDTKLTRGEIEHLSKRSCGDIPKNIEEKLTKRRK